MNISTKINMSWLKGKGSALGNGHFHMTDQWGISVHSFTYNLNSSRRLKISLNLNRVI